MVNIPWAEVALAAIAAFQGWLALRVVEQGRKQVELEAKLTAQQQNCVERLHWMRDMDMKLNQIATDTATIRVKLGESVHDG